MSPSPPMADLSPSDCERIIIVGAGGFGREVLQWARHAWPSDVHRIAGFLSADPDKLDGHAPTLPILGTPADFQPQPSDGLVLAIGVPGVRRQVAEQLEANGGRFLTLIHPTAIVADTAQIGTGSIICPYVIVSDATTVGSFALLNFHTSLGHDAALGELSVLSPYASLGGGSRVGCDAFLGIRATVGPKCMVGDRSKLSAHAVVTRDVPPDSFAFGVPGRIGPIVKIA